METVGAATAHPNSLPQDPAASQAMPAATRTTTQDPKRQKQCMWARNAAEMSDSEGGTGISIKGSTSKICVIPGFRDGPIEAGDLDF